MARKKADSAETQETGVEKPQSEAPAEGAAERQNTGPNDGEGDGGGAGDPAQGEGESGGEGAGEVAAGAGAGPDQPGMFTAASAQIAGLPPAVSPSMHEAHKGYVDVKGDKVDMNSVFEKQGPKGRTYRVNKRVFEETTVPGNPGATRRRLVYGEGRVIPDHEYLEAMDGAERAAGTGEAGQ
jgi:hypothetical protein